ncbi:MAG: GxxExxY protein [Candidatus Omnitrophica bacterium]|nr:GxxExxY protein [Candidatus Omnitrophota bacterium]
MNKTNRDSLTERIIACCYKVHSELGPGFSEKLYHKALLLAFADEGLSYETEKRYDMSYIKRKVGYCVVDLVVENKVIVEIKAVVGYMPDVFKYQIRSYLRASHLKVGLLINFSNKSCQVKRYSM